jgi:hypothetical protein
LFRKIKSFTIEEKNQIKGQVQCSDTDVDQRIREMKNVLEVALLLEIGLSPLHPSVPPSHREYGNPICRTIMTIL